jgi:NAD(P)-dependent dehydrogenase (short-subunit alcohol dehydrogenase family)
LVRFTESLDHEVSESGVKVFAMNPGLVRTAMTMKPHESGAQKRWLPRIYDMLEQGQDLPPTMAAALAVEIASGRLDDLHGRLLSVRDDLEQVLAQKDRILAEDLKTLRLLDLR